MFSTKAALVLFLLRFALHLYKGLDNVNRRQVAEDQVLKELQEVFYERLEVSRQARDRSRVDSESGGLHQDDGHRRG